MFALLLALESALSVLFWVVLIQAIFSWLPGVVSQSGFLSTCERSMARVTEPLLDPIRSRMPGGAMLDLSPMILLVLIQVVRWLLPHLLA